MKEVLINPRYAENKELQTFIENLPASFENGGTILWDGRNKIRSYAVEASMAEGVMVVKKFKHLSLIQKVVYAMRTHKARKAYMNGLELVKRGFSTPEPLACVEIKNGPWLQNAYYLSGATSLPCIEDLTDRDDWDKNLTKAFARFAAELHERGVLHHDLNDTNVLYAKDAEGGYTFTLIDINRMKFYAPGVAIPIKECIENITRFTGRLDLFEYVAREYAEARGFDVEAFAQRAVAQKRQHDRNWYRRKRLSRIFKHKKIKKQ